MGEKGKSRARTARAVACLLSFAGGLSVADLCSAQPAAPQGPLPSRADAGVSADLVIQVIRSRLTQRLSGLPQIDEIGASDTPDLYEVRLGNDLYYGDAQGNFFIRGELIETRSQRNPTRECIDKITAIEFDKLPLQDAIVWKTGTGQRRIAVFADPNCRYCRKLETEPRGTGVADDQSPYRLILTITKT